MSTQVGLGENMVILQFLQADILSATPVSSIARGEQAKHSAVDGARGVAGKSQKIIGS